ncbi:MAG TPA: hypothetical protein VGA18_07150, partial [Rhodothermales bacterium]
MIEPNNISPTTPKPPRRRKWLRRTAWTIATFTLIVGLAIGTLRTDWAADKIRGIAENQVSAALHNGRLEIGTLEGNLLYNLAATDVRLFSGDSLVVSIDSVRAEFNLFAFLTGGFRVYEVDLIYPVVTARQLPDSTWDLLNLAPDDTSATGDPFALQFDRVRIVQGSGSARFHGTQPDSTIYAHDLNAAMRAVYFEGGNFGTTVDEASVRIVAPVAPEPVSVNMRGELRRDQIFCAPCTIESARSDVSLAGNLLFPDTSALRGDIRFDFDPLVLGDIAFALPDVDQEESVVGTASVTGASDSISAHVELAFLSGASTNLNALITTRDSARVRIMGEISRLNPAVLQPGLNFVGMISSEVDIDLTGSSLETVSGPVTIRTFDTVLNGVELRDSHLTGQFEKGTGHIETRLFLPGVALDVRGSVAPLADTLEYDLAGSFSAHRLSNFYQSAPDIEAEGRFEVAGRGTSLKTASGRTVVWLTGLTAPQFQLGESRVEARLDRGEIALSAQIAVLGRDASDAGSVGLDATVRQADGQWHAETRNLTLSHLDLQAISAESPAGLISATGWLSADLTADSLLRAAGSLAISGHVGPITFSDTKLIADFEAGSGTFDIDAQSNIGDAEARGDFRSVEGGYE